MPLTLQLYVFRQLVVSVGFALSGIAIVVLPVVAISAIHKLGAVGLSAVARYLPLVIVDLVPYLMPMAFLLGVVVTYGRLAAERELIAIRMAAIHPARLALPAFGLAIVLSLGTGHLLSTVSPTWNYEQRNFLRKVDKEAFESLAPGRPEMEFGDSSLVALDRVGNVFFDVLLDLETGEGERLTVMADAVEVNIEEGDGGNVLQLEFENAHVLGDDARLYDEFPFWKIPLHELFPPRPANRMRAKFLPSAEIRDLLASDVLEPEIERDMIFHVHSRYALAGTYLLFLLLGIPTGIVLRSSTQLGAITGASGFAFLYYALALQLGSTLAKSGIVHPIVAAWATDGIFAVAGVVAFYRSLCR